MNANLQFLSERACRILLIFLGKKRFRNISFECSYDSTGECKGLTLHYFSFLCSILKLISDNDPQLYENIPEKYKCPKQKDNYERVLYKDYQMVDNDLLNIILNIDNWNDDIVVDPNRNQHFNAFIDFCENIENLCKVESDVSKSDSIKIFTLKLYVMFLYDDKLKETYDTQLRGFLKQVKLDINQKSLCISETSFVIDAIAVLEKAKNSSYVSNHERSEGIKLFFNALQNMLKYSNEKGYIVTLIQKVA